MFLSMCDKIRSGQRDGVNDENDPTSSNCLDMFCQGLSIESTAEFLGDHCVIQTMRRNTSRLSAGSSDLLRLQQNLMKLQQKQLQEQQHLQPQAQGSPESQAQTEMEKWTPLYIDICMIMYDIIDLYIIYIIYTQLYT